MMVEMVQDGENTKAKEKPANASLNKQLATRVAKAVVQIPVGMDQDRTSPTTAFSQRENKLSQKGSGDQEDPREDA